MERHYGLCTWNGETYVGPYPGNSADIFSPQVYVTIVVSKDAFGRFDKVIDLNIDLENGYQTEDSIGGRAVSIRKSLGDDIEAETGVSNILEITISGRASTSHATHPVPEIADWLASKGITGQPDDLMTLKYLEENRIAARLTHEGESVVGLVKDFNRNRESGMLDQKDWRVTITVIGVD